jgi:hypothetical protein
MFSPKLPKKEILISLLSDWTPGKVLNERYYLVGKVYETA